MRERDEKRDGFIIRGKAEGDNFGDIVAAVALKGGHGGIAADDRLTVPMLSILCRRHKLSAEVHGGSFDVPSHTFVRGDGGTGLRDLLDTLDAPGGELTLYTYGLLKTLADELTSNARGDLP